MLQTLLRAGADVTAEIDGREAIDGARNGGHSAVVGLLEKELRKLGSKAQEEREWRRELPRRVDPGSFVDRTTKLLEEEVEKERRKEPAERSTRKRVKRDGRGGFSMMDGDDDEAEVSLDDDDDDREL